MESSRAFKNYQSCGWTVWVPSFDRQALVMPPSLFGYRSVRGDAGTPREKDDAH